MIRHAKTGPDWNSHQRAAWVTIWLWGGSRLSDIEIARLCGMTRGGALKMMFALEAALPITKADDGKWQWSKKGE